jgi:hypothetical protein
MDVQPLGVQFEHPAFDWIFFGKAALPEKIGLKVVVVDDSVRSSGVMLLALLDSLEPWVGQRGTENLEIDGGLRAEFPVGPKKFWVRRVVNPFGRRISCKQASCGAKGALKNGLYRVRTLRQDSVAQLRQKSLEHGVLGSDIGADAYKLFLEGDSSFSPANQFHIVPKFEQAAPLVSDHMICSGPNGKRKVRCENTNFFGTLEGDHAFGFL